MPPTAEPLSEEQQTAKPLSEEQQKKILQHLTGVKAALTRCLGWRELFNEVYGEGSQLPNYVQTDLNDLALGPVLDKETALLFGRLEPPGRALWNRRRREVLFQLRKDYGDNIAKAWQDGMDKLTRALYGPAMPKVVRSSWYRHKTGYLAPVTDSVDHPATIESLVRFSAYTASSVGTGEKLDHPNLESWSDRKRRKKLSAQKPEDSVLGTPCPSSQVDTRSVTQTPSVSAHTDPIAPGFSLGAGSDTMSSMTSGSM